MILLATGLLSEGCREQETTSPNSKPCDVKQSLLKDTSSTAQGGGGSFKNRKPIGELGCCE